MRVQFMSSAQPEKLVYGSQRVSSCELFPAQAPKLGRAGLFPMAQREQTSVYPGCAGVANSPGRFRPLLRPTRILIRSSASSAS